MDEDTRRAVIEQFVLGIRVETVGEGGKKEAEVHVTYACSASDVIAIRAEG